MEISSPIYLHKGVTMWIIQHYLLNCNKPVLFRLFCAVFSKKFVLIKGSVLQVVLLYQLHLPPSKPSNYGPDFEVL